MSFLRITAGFLSEGRRDRSRPRDAHSPRIWFREQRPIQGNAARRDFRLRCIFRGSGVRQSSHILAIPFGSPPRLGMAGDCSLCRGHEAVGTECPIQGEGNEKAVAHPGRWCRSGRLFCCFGSEPFRKGALSLGRYIRPASPS